MTPLYKEDIGYVMQSISRIFLAFTRQTIEFEVRHQEPSERETPLRSLVILFAVNGWS